MTASLSSQIPVVYVVDDDASVRESLSSLIRSAGMAVEVFASPFDFLAKKNLSELSCVVLDVRMPGLDGLALQEKIVALGGEIPIIFITGHGDVPLAVRAMKAGAIDFLNKPFKDTDLLEAIAVALVRVSATVNERSSLTSLRQRFETLTAREKQIMFAVAEGKQNKAIAYDLCVTESTVKVHKHNVMLKMNIRSVAELTLAIQRLKHISK
ncbi:response regulator transcription factor [Dechloromonas sp. HYN0024]|uniref:response regulator transcription factor n=1 Tax=Dechloromonas sp. HYN0024 TaxID=2231055 RepID=UPI000E44C3D3|nr:response regulator [Dechloromonas sp. HYN0024]AXS80274.1 DNA-binding response regulator [Dechloromonas sp. HYN0024]